MSWFLERFHLMGAVLVTVIGGVFARTLALARIKALMRIPIGHLLPWKSLGTILTVAVLSAIPVVILNSVLRMAPIFLLPVTGTTYILTYVTLVLIFRVLKDSERETIGAWFLTLRRMAVRA